MSSKCYSLSFITNCIQLVLAWHARPNVLFSYRTCSCFSAATLQPYATQTSLISVSVRSFPSPSSASSSFSVSSTYLSLTCSGLTGIWLFGLVWDCGLFWFVFDLVPNASPYYTLSRWRGVKNHSFISVSLTLLGMMRMVEWTENTGFNLTRWSRYHCVFLWLQTSTNEQEAICSRMANHRSQTFIGTEGCLFNRLCNVVLVKIKSAP